MEETVCSIHRESNPVHPATECSVTAVALYMWVGDLLGYATFVEEAPAAGCGSSCGCVAAATATAARRGASNSV